MAIWEEMKEYGVDQNTISYNSLLPKSKEPRRNGGTRIRMNSWTLSMWMSSLALLRTASGLPPTEARALAESLPAGFGLRETLIDLLPRVAHASQAKVNV